MTQLEACAARHSVRQYTDKPISDDIIKQLSDEIEKCNAESGLTFVLKTNDSSVFDNFVAHYGSFSGVNNYIVFKGKDSPDLDEKAGYYGQRILLLAAMLGLDSCWTAMSFKKAAVKKSVDVKDDERIVCVAALGYGVTHGSAHKSKPMEQLCSVQGEMPDDFKAGMQCAMLAPTAVNQQKFLFELSPDGKVTAKAFKGPCSKVDLGIVKYQFEVGYGRKI